MMKKAFTLAEVMITLVVIGIITAIVMPIMVNSSPKQKYMKFKKAHTTLGKVIRELVNSDQYYMDGDMGKRTSGDYIDGTHDGDYTYFCETFADIISAKYVNCKSTEAEYGWIGDDWVLNGSSLEPTLEKHLDTVCKRNKIINDIGAEIITADGVVYYQTDPHNTFGLLASYGRAYYRKWDRKGINESNYCVIEEGCKDDPGFYYYVEKVICVDIDGINKGEDPFGYGIRIDGKIILGARAQQWLEKDFNGKDPSEQE